MSRPRNIIKKFRSFVLNLREENRLSLAGIRVLNYYFSFLVIVFFGLRDGRLWYRGMERAMEEVIEGGMEA